MIPGDIEIKRDNVYEKGYASKCFIIRAVESKVNEIDLKLQAGFGEGTHIKYISFKATDSKTKVGCLHTNNCRNIASRFELIHNADVNNMINSNNKWYFLKDFILNTKINNKPIFIGVE